MKFQSKGPILLVRFVSDGEKHCTGYEARWQAVINDSSLITCSDGWLNFNDYCLWVADDRVTWEEAAALCHSNDSYLVTINNKDMHRFISDILRLVEIQCRDSTMLKHAKRDVPDVTLKSPKIHAPNRERLTHVDYDIHDVACH